MILFKKLKEWWQSLRYYVIVDPADNSVTLSKALFNHIKDNAQEGDAACVFVFKVGKSYGFMPNPGIEQVTQMCDIQYNSKYRCIGFETLCPSVGQILYDYGLPATSRARLSVSLCHTHPGKLYYEITRPNAQHLRQHP